MFTSSGRIKLLVALLCIILRSCTARYEHRKNQSCASSCGNIHNISYPFRLKTDPKDCGNSAYELTCVANAVILYVNVRGVQVVGYRVQAINYNNFTIRLADPNVFTEDCSVRVMTTSLNTYDDPDYLRKFINQIYGFRYRFGSVVYSNRYTYECQDLIFVSCPFPLVGFNSSCNKVDVNNSDISASYTKRYWYVNVGAMNVSDLENSCRIEYKSWTSLLPEGVNNISYNDVNNTLAYGFELSWNAPVLRINLFQEIQYWLWTIFIPYLLFKGLLCFCGTPCVAFFLIRKWRRRHLSAYENIEKYLNCNENNLMPIRYSYSQIKKMTKGFMEKLGEGGFGSVYKGKLRSGNFAAVKMLDKSKANGQDFINEVATIGRIHHTNVVQLIGFCVEGSKRALVYEFMVNGSLDKYIFSKEGCIPINNKKIFDICLGIAHGIKYLHQGCNMQILHFDIKPHNILLDENFVPKISDFGLAKLHTSDRSIVSLTAARGTIGYMAPELFYKNIGDISYKVDIYSFGMLLMEMVGRRKNLNVLTEHSSQIYFPSWIYHQISAEKNIKLGDDQEEENKMVKNMIIVALWCIQLKPIDRPSMHEVIKMLEGDVEHLQMPPKPFFSPQEVNTNDAGLISCSVDMYNYSDTIHLLSESD